MLCSKPHEGILKINHHITNYLSWQGHIRCPRPLDIVATIHNMQGGGIHREMIPNHPSFQT